MIEITDVEARVLGCLVEKSITTPDYYPMTLNALTLACNQKSNRHPVVAYEETTVVRALDGLREKKLAWMVHAAGSRVPKYEHRLAETLPLPPDQLAVLCLLLLRGPQTAGELKGRSGRLHLFNTNAEVEVCLHQLSAQEEGPLVTRLPLRPGAREHRYQHVLCGEPEISEASVEVGPEPARRTVAAENERLDSLAEEVAALKEAMASLRAEFAEFKAQFE